MPTKNGSSTYQLIGTRSGAFKTSDLSNTNDFGYVLQANNIYNRNDIKWYDRYSRFGVIDPYNSVTTTKEYLFFTKPDLHIYEPGTETLNSELANYPFWQDLNNRYPKVIEQLQMSRYSPGTSAQNVFMTLLSNAVKNSLDLPGISANTIDTATNIYGTSINYRGDGYTEDENVTFTLEFEDTKYLEVYHLLKAYEEYERLKKQGIISPPNVGKAKVSKSGYAYTNYHKYRELHDQFGVYKFVVGEDFETLIYWAYIYGVYFKSVPRDAFSDLKVDGGLRYSVEFGGWLVDDMNPDILLNFNKLIRNNMKVPSTNLPVYNTEKQMINGRWAKVPLISMRKKQNVKATAWNAPTGMKYDYVLKWRV